LQTAARLTLDSGKSLANGRFSVDRLLPQRGGRHIYTRALHFRTQRFPEEIMRTAIIIAIGLALLGLFVIIGRLSGLGLARLVPWFIVLWMLVAGVNLWIGVARAGYSFTEELPIFLIIFGIPAAAAIILARMLRG
jgi:hypothetical protein